MWAHEAVPGPHTSPRSPGWLVGALDPACAICSLECTCDINLKNFKTSDSLNIRFINLLSNLFCNKRQTPVCLPFAGVFRIPVSLELLLQGNSQALHKQLNLVRFQLLPLFHKPLQKENHCCYLPPHYSMCFITNKMLLQGGKKYSQKGLK